MLDTPDLDGAPLLTTDQAATLAHVTIRVIQNWVDRGLLRPVGQDERGRNLFRKLDVLLVERDTRRAPRLAKLQAEARAQLIEQSPDQHKAERKRPFRQAA